MMNEKDIEVGKHYTNIKTGNVYEVLHIGKHSETQESVVVYRKLESNEVWVRPFLLFLEKFKVYGIIEHARTMTERVEDWPEWKRQTFVLPTNKDET